MQYKDYYQILGVEENSTKEEIKSAYRKLVKEYHPDKNQGDKNAEDKFKEISEAYEVLGNVESRDKYDTMRNQSEFKNGYDFDPNMYGFSNAYDHHSNDMRSDFFNMFFSGFGFNDHSDNFTQNRNHIVIDGEDIEATLKITPSEGHNGITKRITLQTTDGSKTLDFKIPKGVGDNEMIRLKGLGQNGINGGKNGNLYIRIQFVDDQRFSKKRNDIYTTVDLYPWEAALGVKKEVYSLDKKIKVSIPENSQSGNKIRIPNRGYASRENRQGDLYIVLRIINPIKITPKMNELYKQLQNLAG